ncbi:MAG: amino acid permease [Leptolyngbya sp. PLA1]|nr:amino acid permease [Leptolyngbya sp. PLA1]
MTSTDLPRRITVWGAAAVQVGIIIGSGIFRTPPQIAGHLASPVVILALWLAGGVLALLGALTYAELATLHPQSGGVYVFLREAYGRCVAFVFGWSYMLVSKPLAAAGIAVVFAEHLNTLLGTSWDVRWPTIAMLMLLTAINIRGVVLSAGVATFLTGLKFAALSAIVLLPWITGKAEPANLSGTLEPGSFTRALVPVFAGIMWTYDGWSDVGAIAGEIKDPQKNLPRVFVLGTLATTLLYVLVNIAFFVLVPLEKMRGADTVAPAVFAALLGPAAGLAAAALVIVSTSGSTHGSIMTGARVTYQQSRDGLLFAFLSGVHPRWKTPWVALTVQLALSCMATIFVKTFEKLAGGFVFTMWVWYALAAAAIFVLRRTQADRPRPYRCWGYPVVPGVFVLAAGGMTVITIAEDWKGTLLWLSIMSAGVPAYFVWDVFRRPASA